MTDDRRELEKLRVGIARIAQAMRLHEEIPGRPEGDFTSLCRKAESHERGWNRLLACISIETDNYKRRDERLIEVCRELGKLETARDDALLLLNRDASLDAPPATRLRAMQQAITKLEATNNG